MANHNFSQQAAPYSPFINLFYLNPLTCMAEMTDGAGKLSSGMPLLFGHTPIWLVTTVSYLLITGVCLLLMSPFVARAAKRPVLPYEDMHARA